jgi:hypothetical protein
MSDRTPGLYRINLQHLADNVINERYGFGADLGFGQRQCIYASIM